jgi:hypothetical protein
MLICFANSQMRARYKQFHVRMDIVFICNLYVQTVVHEQILIAAINMK